AASAATRPASSPASSAIGHTPSGTMVPPPAPPRTPPPVPTMSRLAFHPAHPLPMPKRPVGRPRVSDDPEQRALHQAAATAVLLSGVPRKRVAFAFDVSTPTVARWIALALGYEGPIGN